MTINEQTEMKPNNLNYLKLVQDMNDMLENDFCMDMDCKLHLHDGRDKNSFTQEEAQQMADLIGKLYTLSHYWYCHCGLGKGYEADQPKTTSTDIEVNDYIGLTDFMRGKLDKYTQDILDETERLDIWNTKSQLGKARKYIFNLLAKVFERGVDSGIDAYKTLMTDGLSTDDTVTVGNIKSDTMNAKSWAMNWCAMCNKPSNKLNEDSICPQCL